MRILSALLAGAAALSLLSANELRAEPPGWYIGVEGGWSHLNAPTFNPTVGGTSLGSFSSSFSAGFGAGAYFGYAGVFFPNLRFQGEAIYRQHNASSFTGPFLGPPSTTLSATGAVKSLGLMTNLIYDFNNSTRWTPYVGAGIGGANVKLSNVGVPSLTSFTFSNSQWEFAYQAIGGIKYSFNSNWSASLDYRYFATIDPTFTATVAGMPTSVTTQYSTHNVLLGIAYRFTPPSPPPPAVQPAAQPAPPPPPPRTFFVYFDFDRYNLTSDGAKVVQDASAAFKTMGSVRIMVTGYTDLVGTQLYNLGLSKRRADTVRAELVRDGVPATAIVEAWRGKEDPAVPTADGVREARNRRVEIVL